MCACRYAMPWALTPRPARCAPPAYMQTEKHRWYQYPTEDGTRRRSTDVQIRPRPAADSVTRKPVHRSSSQMLERAGRTVRQAPRAVPIFKAHNISRRCLRRLPAASCASEPHFQWRGAAGFEPSAAGEIDTEPSLSQAPAAGLDGRAGGEIDRDRAGLATGQRG